MIGLLAHGVGSRSDLPLPVWLFAYGAGFALVISFVALRVLWPRPRFAAAAAGRDLPSALQLVRPVVDVVLRVVGLALFGVVVYAAGWGNESGVSNISPYAVCIVFWVGVPALVALMGDVWSALNPFDTIARLMRLPEKTGRRDPGQWTAALMLLSFVWLELAYHLHCGDPRSLATWLIGYSAAAVIGAALWGRRWLRHGEGFAALFGLLALLSPFFRDPETGRLRARMPFSGLSTLAVRPGTMALVFVALGSTSFDGFTRSTIWNDIASDRTGWSATIVSTVGLLFMIAVVALAYLAATRVTARIVGQEPIATAERFIASLVPIILAYAFAHYFSLFVFDGQNALALASDPFGRGWDLFGTIDETVDYRAVSTRTIAYVQVGAIVLGHVVGVVAAHDRAVESYERRVVERSQYPLLAVMVLYTVGGLGLLLGS
jgi:hypothetical protein